MERYLLSCITTNAGNFKIHFSLGEIHTKEEKKNKKSYSSYFVFASILLNVTNTLFVFHFCIDQFSELSRKNNFCPKRLFARCISRDYICQVNTYSVTHCIRIRIIKCIACWLIEMRGIADFDLNAKANDSLVYICLLMQCATLWTLLEQKHANGEQVDTRAHLSILYRLSSHKLFNTYRFLSETCARTNSRIYRSHFIGAFASSSSSNSKRILDNKIDNKKKVQ